jgi:alpha-mannosidase
VALLVGPLVPLTAVAQSLDPASFCERAIKPWLLAGPFPVDTGSARLDRQDVGDPAVLAPTAGATAQGHAWRAVNADAAGELDFATIFDQTSLDNTASYAITYMASPTARTVQLGVESDDDVVVWLNGKLVERRDIARSVGLGRDTVSLHLEPGVNRLLYKIVNRGGGTGLGARLLVGNGSPIEDIAIANTPTVVATQVASTSVGIGSVGLAGDPVLVANEPGLRVPVRACVTARAAVAPHLNVQVGQSRITTSTPAAGVPAPVTWEAAWSDLAAPASHGAVAASAEFADHSADSSQRATTIVAAAPGDLLDLLARPITAIGWTGPEGPMDTVRADSAARRAMPRIQFRTTVGNDLSGLTLVMHVGEFMPSGQYSVNGRALLPDTLGRVTVCAPCHAGEALDIVVTPNGARWWDPPVFRIADLGWHEMHDGAEWARFFTHDSSLAVPSEADARALLAAVVQPDKAAYMSIVNEWQTKLAPAVAKIRRDTIDIVGNSHIDAAWLWRWRETQQVVDATWSTATKLMAKYPDMHFAASAAQYYVWLEQRDPATLARIQKLESEGRWNLVGGWWLEPDVNMPSGESLVRQGLYGQRTFMRLFGHPARVAWIPDTFGYPWSLPQIFLGSGMDFFVTQKLRWNDTNKWPARLNDFYWQGPDGSRVFAYIPYGYDSDLNPKSLANQEEATIDSSATRHMLTLYGVGDHGGGPTMEMLERSHDLKRIPAFPVLRDADPAKALERMRADFPADGPVVRDELYLEYHRGVFTTQAAIKHWNRRMEGTLEAAEAAATIAPGAYPRAALTSAWEKTLFNQFHDVLSGSGIDSVYMDAKVDYAAADSLATGAMTDALRGIAAKLDTRPLRAGDRPFVVFNPSARSRSEDVIVQLPAGIDVNDWGVVDGRGNVLASDVADPSCLRVRVDGVPALGARVLFLRKGAKLMTPTLRTSAGNVLENAYLRVEIDSVTGGIARMYDKVNKRDVLARGPATNGLVLMVDQPKDYDAWNIDNLNGARTWLVTGGDNPAPVWRRDPIGTSVTVTRGRPRAMVTQRYSLPDSARWLSVETTVDWHESHQLLKAALPFAFEMDSTRAEIPYAVMPRTTRPRTRVDSARFETPMLRFVDGDARDGTYGAAIVTAGKYGYSASGDTVFITLLRSPKSPDENADMGTQHFTYAIVPHAGDWRSPSVREAARTFNEPLRAAMVPAHAGVGRVTKPVITIESGSVELGALKRAEDGNGWILRLVETSGRPTTARLRFSHAVTATETDMLERPSTTVFHSTGATLSIPMKPWKIETVLIANP